MAVLGSGAMALPVVPTRLRTLALACGLALLESSAAADRTVLHEYFEPDDQEDLLLEATTLDGKMPVAIDTPSGIIPAPDSAGTPRHPSKAYGGASTPDSPDAAYRVDRNTARPKTVSYDDPFNPSVAPFKRLYAFDAVDEHLELVVADKSLRPVEVGDAHPAGEDLFYGVLVVDLARDAPVRIPSVGPGARVLSAQASPPVKFEILRDGADNWFIRAAARKRVRLTVLLAISRDVFGSKFRDVSYGELPTPRGLPIDAQRAARRVAERIGVSPVMRPRHVLESLVTYFRGFAPSTQLPDAVDPVGLYEELALSQKGVCRHRAYAFTLTALHLGLPTRMVRNEAHAWVEVSDGQVWHRIDLGGAAGELDLSTQQTGFQHVPPPDPHPWPPGADRGDEMARRAREGLGLSGSTPPVGTGARPDPLRPSGSSVRSTSPLLASPTLPPTRVEVAATEGDVRRGDPLQIAGRVTAKGRGCAAARVDVALLSSDHDPIPLGSLPTGNDGRFAGSVTVRLDVRVGDYDLVVTTPGTTRCGPGTSSE